MKSSPRSPQLEKARTQQQRPNTAKKKKRPLLTYLQHILLAQVASYHEPTNVKMKSDWGY